MSTGSTGTENMSPESVSPKSMSPESISPGNISPGNNTPALRFKGFEGVWEERKASDFAEYAKGRGYSKSDLSETGTPIILYGRLYTDYQFSIENVDTYTTAQPNSIISQGNEVIVPASGETAEDIARASAVVKPGIILGGDLNIARPDKSIAPAFLALSLSNGSSKQELARMAQGKSIVHIHNADIQKLSITFPSHSEQRSIIEYFSLLDRLLSLQNKKIEKLQSFKKAMLDKMFPQKGSKVPEIRFKGFTGEWEDCKVKDLCTIETGKSNTQDQVTNGDYPFYIRSDIPVRSNKFLYDCEAVITIGDGNIGRVFHYVNGKFDLHQRCYKMSDFHEIWGKYFFYYFSAHFYDRAMKMTAKATVDSVRLEMIADMDIWKPIQIEEQKKIANYFSQLDHLISLQALKLNKLKGLKKALLEGMFPMPKT